MPYSFNLHWAKSIAGNPTDKMVQRFPLWKKTVHLVRFNPDNLFVFPAAGSTHLPDVIAD